MRHHITAAVSAAVLALLASGCSGEQVETVQVNTDPAPTELADGNDDHDADGSDIEGLLDEYGELLATAAVSGGDALERTLSYTAAGDHDPACAPEWAHDLLDQADDGVADVVVTATGVRVGSIDVPAEADSGRALHLGGDCDAPLPQPDRAPAEPNEPNEPDDTSVTADQPAPQREAPDSQGTSGPISQAQADYDTKLNKWASTIWAEYPSLIDSWNQLRGRNAHPQLTIIAGQIDNGRRHWSRVHPPQSRAAAHEALLEGLEWWALETRWYATCSRGVSETCETQPQQAKNRRVAEFDTVESQTGVSMPLN